ncbi:MAG: ATP-binding protein [Clostridiales bacterium]|jgi:serine/threonine-protein kinase RsbW|nr:ATP-binding protein [Clostridiales bacterium]
MNKYKASFRSELEKVKLIINDISLFLANTIPNLSTENQTEFKLIFSELLCNAVIHGNQNDKNKLVDVYIEINGGYVYSIVSDQGPGFDYISCLNSLENDSSLYKETGRGIRLVCSLSDTISFNPKGNIIKFQKKVN